MGARFGRFSFWFFAFAGLHVLLADVHAGWAIFTRPQKTGRPPKKVLHNPEIPTRLDYWTLSPRPNLPRDADLEVWRVQPKALHIATESEGGGRAFVPFGAGHVLMDYTYQPHAWTQEQVLRSGRVYFDPPGSLLAAFQQTHRLEKLDDTHELAPSLLTMLADFSYGVMGKRKILTARQTELQKRLAEKLSPEQITFVEVSEGFNRNEVPSEFSKKGPVELRIAEQDKLQTDVSGNILWNLRDEDNVTVYYKKGGRVDYFSQSKS